MYIHAVQLYICYVSESLYARAPFFVSVRVAVSASAPSSTPAFVLVSV